MSCCRSFPMGKSSRGRDYILLRRLVRLVPCLLNKARFGLMQSEFQTNRINVRIEQALDTGIESPELGLRTVSGLMNCRPIINEFAPAKNRHEQIMVSRGVRDLSSDRNISNVK